MIHRYQVVGAEPVDGGSLPEPATNGAVGMDLRAREGGMLGPGGRAVVPVGFKLELPVGVEAQIRPRSGLAIKHGVTVLNAPGTIDPDYRGEVGVILHNASQDPFRWRAGDRIAQMVFAKYEHVVLSMVGAVTETVRGDGGFGSTGVE